MTIQTDIIAPAFRLAKIRGAGEDPSPDEEADALTVFQGILYALLVARAPLTDVIISADYTAGENERIFNTGSGAETITLPETITDTTVTSGERPPKNGAIVEIAGETHQATVYVSHFGAWKQLQGLVLTDESPLGPAHNRDLVAILALHLVPEYLDHEPSAVLVALAQQARTSIRQRFRQSKAVPFDPVLVGFWQRARLL